MITKGEDYNELKKSFVIFICTFDPFNHGRHMYTFENRCNEEYSLVLDDETTKIFLNTTGTILDVDEEMLEFLAYVENSTDAIANRAKSKLVKEINEKVSHIKQDKSMEVEYMTLLERDREKYEEGKEEGKLEAAKALLDLLDDEIIAERIGIPLDEVKELRKHK